MATLSPPTGRTSRTRLVAVLVAILGVSLVVAGAVWYAGRNDPAPLSAVSPTATSAATTPAAKGAVATKKPTAKAKAKAKTSTTRSKTPAKKPSVAAKKLPAGVVEPGRKVKAPVDVKDTSVADSVRVDLVGFTSVKSKPKGPGEISAPAVRLTIRLTNTGSTDVALNTVVVNAYYGKSGTPGIPILGDPAGKSFAGSLKPGAKATGVFVFNMPVSKRGDATITVSPSPSLPIAVFAGSVA